MYHRHQLVFYFCQNLAGYEWYKLNERTVEKSFGGNLGGIQLNAFTVAANETAYGVHNARSVFVGCNYECTDPYHNCMVAMKQISFHTALEDVSFDNQPLVIYEDAVPEVPTPHYMVRSQLPALPATVDSPHINIIDEASLHAWCHRRRQRPMEGSPCLRKDDRNTKRVSYGRFVIWRTVRLRAVHGSSILLPSLESARSILVQSEGRTSIALQ